jgi:hypothetical protein
MLSDGVETAAVKPGLWLSACSSDGASMRTGWTRPLLTAFLVNLTASGVKALDVWTDGAGSEASVVGPGSGGGLEVCSACLFIFLLICLFVVYFLFLCLFVCCACLFVCS